ncbi:membrane-associated guanylate kinase, WW and PDZ domain-containing protein 2-like [Platysternon megacephalum]|uniref:Membrane-associated guanylate kinase, WW and PDZ domain-containing protein 2-like n=1 Tax=Platysternon megacephalum TaxID=55544 RepID=A0A4D9EGL6_9SAUR|nr:membrane-associated guanylate kinase, WW and PDZ domain-containing protein 2-like [Platysternon megacephalum]
MACISPPSQSQMTIVTRQKNQQVISPGNRPMRGRKLVGGVCPREETSGSTSACDLASWPVSPASAPHRAGRRRDERQDLRPPAGQNCSERFTPTHPVGRGRLRPSSAQALLYSF